MQKKRIDSPTTFPVVNAGIRNAVESDPSDSLPISASLPKLVENIPEIAVPDKS